MFDTFQLTSIMISLIGLLIAILAIIGVIGAVLYIFKPRAYTVFKGIVSPILKLEGKVLKRFWKQLTFLIIAAFCSTLLVDVTLPDYFDQLFFLRGLYALLAFGLLSATVISHYRFKTDRTWFLRIALASAITLSAAILFYQYNYPTHAMIIPPFNYQTQTLITISASSLVATVTFTAAIGIISRINSHGSVSKRSGYESSMEFLPTDHTGAISIDRVSQDYYQGKPRQSQSTYYDNSYEAQEYKHSRIVSSLEVHWFRVTEIPESYQEEDAPEETNPHSFESGRMVSALAKSGIHFGLLVAFKKGKGKIYYGALGRSKAETLRGVLHTFHPGLIHEETGVSLGRVGYVAVVEVRAGYPHLQNVVEHVLEYFAQSGCTGVVHSVVEPYGLMGRHLTKRSKKERYREIQDTGERYIDPQVELEALRKGYAVIRGDVKAGLYVAVTSQNGSIAESHARNLASLIRGAFTRDSKVKVILGGGARRRLERMFTLSQSANLDLTFSEAEALVKVPKIEVGGAKITKTVQFSQDIPEIPTSEGIFMGHLIRNGIVLKDRPIVIPLFLLCKNIVLTGKSGSGKTMAAMVMLLELGLFGGIFRFVIEYRKREYRRMILIEDGEKKPLVFPFGKQGCRFRYNPLYVYPSETVSQKISDLTWIFNKLYVLYAPMDTVLEIALDLTYEEKGWSWKGEEDVRGETPTIADLCSSIEVAMESLDYDEEAKKNIRTGLMARLSTLCTGPMSPMFMCQENTPFELLRDSLVVFELDGLGEKDKPFYAFLSLYYLYENIKGQKPSDPLGGVILVEEAHNIFEKKVLNPDSDSRAGELAREFLEDLFRTMRAQGWGLGVSDQNPTNLPEEVMQNCSVQIVGRQVNADDRECIAKNMFLNEKQSEALEGLRDGELALGLEAPAVLGMGRNLEAEFPVLKPGRKGQVQDVVDGLVRERMKIWYQENGFPPADSAGIPSKLEFFEKMERVRELVSKIRTLVRTRDFARAYLDMAKNCSEKLLEEYLTALSENLARRSGFRREKVFHYLACIAKGRYGELV